VTMLELALDDRPWAVVDDFELRSPPPSYSVRTARHMRERFPQARLFWIVGLDQWQALPHWREPEALASLLDFVVFSRGGEEPGPRPGWRMHFIPGTHPASATRIREALADGETPPPWLPGPVLDHIRSRNLYS